MAKSYTIQYDALGRPYFDMPGMKGPSYVSPAALGQAAPADTTGIFRKGPQWNQNTGKWETPIDWSNVLNVGVGTALTAGVGSAIAAAHTAPLLGSTAPNVIEGAGVAGIEGGVGAGAGAGAGVGAGVGAGAGAGAKMGIKTLLELGAQYGLPTLGNVIDTKITTGAQADALRIQQEYYNKALAAALEEQAYERKRLEEQTAYDRAHSAEMLGINQGNFGNYLETLSPYRKAGTTALERMQAALGGSPWQPNNGVTRTFL